ncbi:MAG: 2,3-bisphosphoglycerate-independent phosphoglycerate mutase [Gaiellaceae bacterium]
MSVRPVALVVLDGWGCAAPSEGNAVALAETPVFDELWSRNPHSTLAASGLAVGLPEGQMGNSEVGHLTIGAGRRIYQDLVRVNNAIDEGSLFRNDSLVAALERAAQRGGNVHLIGLVSYGGVHSHIDHIRALAELARGQGFESTTYLHAFTDGRDVSPTAAGDDLAELVSEGMKIATVCGRYWAMDRDNRWERIDRALAALLAGDGTVIADPVQAVRDSYMAGTTDEFIEPVVVEGTPRISRGDVVLFANFRPDRARQLSQRLLDAGIDLTTMTRYSELLRCPVVFAEQRIEETLAEVVSEAGLAQLHVAETEKYAHVTYFLNGGREEPWPGERRELVASPSDVATYDQKPAMSAAGVANAFTEGIGSAALGVVNFANPDMVGHTGVIPAVIRAVEEVDRCLGEVVAAVRDAGGVSLVFADHGNAETMLEADGVSPNTAHTTNPVPLIVTGEGLALRHDGGLADIAPTALQLLGLPAPGSMSGRSLIEGD